LINHTFPQPRTTSGISNHRPNSYEDKSGIGWVPNDTIGPRGDELVVFEKGDAVSEMSSHLANGPIPERTTQHHQGRCERCGWGEFDAVWMFAVR
jgi:hypothetical protein